jgi:hypothetical protein
MTRMEEQLDNAGVRDVVGTGRLHLTALTTVDACTGHGGGS